MQIVCKFQTHFSKPLILLGSVGLEHLPYKQRVGGSNPSTPTQKPSNLNRYWVFSCPIVFGGILKNGENWHILTQKGRLLANLLANSEPVRCRNLN